MMTFLEAVQVYTSRTIRKIKVPRKAEVVILSKTVRAVNNTANHPAVIPRKDKLASHKGSITISPTLINVSQNKVETRKRFLRGLVYNEIIKICRAKNHKKWSADCGVISRIARIKKIAILGEVTP